MFPFHWAAESVEVPVALPITEEDVISAASVVEAARSLQDLGIRGLVWWRCVATCSRHGRILRYEETAGDAPEATGLSCIACRREGLDRSCPIVELEVITGRKPPIVGEGI